MIARPDPMFSEQVQEYLDVLDSLQKDYPEVVFAYMIGNAQQFPIKLNLILSPFLSLLFSFGRFIV